MSYDPNNDPTDLARHQERHPHECDADPGRHGPDDNFRLPCLTPAARRFVELARGGSLPTASSGERAALRLACWVKDDIPYLDADAVKGFQEFITYVESFPQTLQELLTPPREIIECNRIMPPSPPHC